MPSDDVVSGSSGWTMLLADIVALMLAFFVLAFSMRAMTNGDRLPDGSPADRVAGAIIAPVGDTLVGEGAVPTPLARSPVDGQAVDQLRAPEQQTTGGRMLAYIAAILEHGADGWLPERIWLDEGMLMVTLPHDVDQDDGAVSASMRPPLLSLAHLAKRFDLDLAIDLPQAAAVGLDAQMALALRVRAWLADAGAAATPEMTFGIVRADGVDGDPSDRPTAALILRPAAAGAMRSDAP
jgi:hypothetical protein